MCFIAPATVPLANATAIGGGAGGLFNTGLFAGGIGGLGIEASNALLAQLSLGGTTGLVNMQRTNKKARFQAEQAVKEAESADLALAREQEGEGARIKEERKANAQEQIALAKQGLRAKGQLLAAERTGLTLDLLLGDIEREEGERRSLLDQTMESMTQQYRRNTLGLKAKRDNRFNVAKSKRNQAQGMAKGGLDVALGTLSSGLSSYTNLLGQAG